MLVSTSVLTDQFTRSRYFYDDIKLVLPVSPVHTLPTGPAKTPEQPALQLHFESMARYIESINSPPFRHGPV